MTPALALGGEAPGRHRLVVAAGWIMLALLFAGVSVSPFAGLEYSGLSGRGAWFAIGMALACGLAAGIALAGAPVAGLLVGVAFLGGIAELWLTEPDWFSAVVFAPRSRADLGMLALIALEGLVALAALWRFGWRFDGRRLVTAGVSGFGLVRPLVLVAALTICSVSLFRYLSADDPGDYAIKLAAVGVLTGIHLAALAAVLAAPDLPRLRARLRGVGRFPLHPALAFAGLALVISAALALAAFHGLGALEDETAYLFQARKYAAGLLTAPPLPPPIAPSFEYYLLDSRVDAWFAATPPGWPAVLALGVLIGAEWLVNPLLAGLTVLLAHRLVERCADRWLANLVALLLATSPWLLATGATLMTHTLSGALITGAWLALVEARAGLVAQARGTACARALLAGLLMGWLFVTRALEGVLIGGLTGMWLVWTLRVRGWPVIVAYALGCVQTGALLFVYNAQLTGDPLVMPLAAYLDRLWGTGGNDFGFGPQIGPPEGWRSLDLWPGHSLAEGLVNTVSALPSLNKELLGWPAGSLVPVGVLLLWGRMPPFARAMAVVVVAVIGIHVFYWFNAVFYVGPRYWYAALLPLAVLSAYGARTLIERLEEAGVDFARERIVTGIVLLAVFATGVFLPWRGLEKYSQRVAASYVVARWAALPEVRNALVILPADPFRRAAILQDPLLRSNRPIFVQDRGQAANARVAAAFPSRRVIRLDCENRAAAPAPLLVLCPARGEGE